MNFYIEACVQSLRAICDGQLHFRDHLAYTTTDIRNRIEGAEHIVVCGLSPIGRNCLAHIGNYADSPKSEFDIRRGDRLKAENTLRTTTYSEGGHSLYIICSREDVLTYLDAIPLNDSKILFYNELLLLDERFGVQNSLLHNRQYVLGAMQSVFDHAEEYLELLDALADTSSKETLARWVLYRLYLDSGLFRGLRPSKRPYFDPPLITLTEKEVFVDAGGYDGDTLSDFLSVTEGGFCEYHFFEPETAVLEKARQAFGADPRIRFYQKGLSNKTTLERYDDACSDMPEMMKSDTGAVMVEVCALDDLHLSPTFVKMDIEGAEGDALDGMTETIRRCKPALAICVYHRQDDPFAIFQKLRQFGYRRFYLRAEKGTLDFDVVLYAE